MISGKLCPVLNLKPSAEKYEEEMTVEMIKERLNERLMRPL